MKKTFFLLCALLLVLGTLLPIAGYRLTLAVFGPAQGLLLALFAGHCGFEAARQRRRAASDQTARAFAGRFRAPGPWSRCPGGNI